MGVEKDDHEWKERDMRKEWENGEEKEERWNDSRVRKRGREETRSLEGM
jgi:hypothetical protein